jgi:signal transduction histidine kinase
MKFLKSEQRVRNNYFAAFALLLIIYTSVFIGAFQMGGHFKRIDHANNSVWTLERIKTCAKDAESTVKSYLFIKKPVYLNAFRTIEKQSDSLLLAAQTLVIPSQKKNTDSLRQLVKQEFHYLNGLVQKSQNNTLNQSELEQIGGPEYINASRIGEQIGKMEKIERQVFNNGNYILYTMSHTFIVINIIGFLISIILGIYAFVTYNKENYDKRVYRHQLEKGIEKLRSTNKELDELRSIEKFAVSGRISRTIAHEVRNPLTNINLACEQLMHPDKDDYVMLLDMIKRNTKRINDLISALLNSTKFSELNPSKVYIHTILDEALQLAADRIDLKDIKILKLYSTPREVEVDVEKMKLAFLNIIINAVEAMEPGKGILKAKIVNQNDQCIVMIEDNGIGMDKNSLSRIFEPYFTSKRDGNGLGLTNTQNIILNHKGKISVESTQGIGTTFSITINYKLESTHTQLDFT